MRSKLPAFDDIALQVWEKKEARIAVIQTECLSPSYPSMDDVEGRFVAQNGVRCRRCAGCLLWRQRQWAARATVEYNLAPRTWWVTLTYRGEQPALYPEVQKFLKRIRKDYQVRYVLSEEEGEKNERLHFHVLLHCDPALSRRAIERCWPHGFVHSRLAKSAGLGRYLAKYLAKRSRIRASVGYGDFLRCCALWRPDLADELESGIRTGGLPAGFELRPYGLVCTGQIPPPI